MPSRRVFLSLLAGSALSRHVTFAQQRQATLALYANVGSVLTHYDVDVDRAELIKRESVTVPARVQYCWPHRSRRYLYVASSDSAAAIIQTGSRHHISVFRVDPSSGALSELASPAPLPVRPIHMSLDNESRHVLVAFNSPSALRVYRIRDDFTIGDEVPQAAFDAGIYAHQVRATPDGRHVVLVTRGNEGTAARPEDPGALMVFDYRDGVLSNELKIAPNGGRGYGPRHLDFHPTKPWMYVSIETQNRIHMHRMQDGKPLPEVVFNKTTLKEPGNIRSRQAASAVHVHPNGRFVYVANRSQDLVDFNAQRVYKGGENSIVVYAIDQESGEPTAIQHIETQKIHPRTFHIDPGGRMLVAEHNLPVNVREGDAVRSVPAGLSVFRMSADGRLTFARAYDIDVAGDVMWWMGMVRL